MRVAGIVAEYDPFHKGHEAHIAATRASGGATHVVAVMSGSFTQRGEPAALSKFDRACMALSCGADLVLELPLPWAMASAERFAAGGVGVLTSLGCVEMLSFGSECGDVSLLERLAALPEREDYRRLLKETMDTGVSYAVARQQAVEMLLGKEAAAPLASPNNTLGMEYIRAARLQGADFDFYTLQRQGTLHHDGAPQEGFASATLLREWLRQGDVERSTAYMPAAAGEILHEAVAAGRGPADPSRLEGALLARLRSMTAADFAALPYVSEGLENRLWQAAQTASTVEEWLTMVKTRRYPMARLRRILWAALLGLPQESDFLQVPYIRVLGMNRRGREILSVARPTLPLLTRSSQVEAMDDAAKAVFALECRATDLHALTLPTPPSCGGDYTKKLLRL
ncbi:MAG: nucleotidyltransferase family protein [Clostridia bacterium]|nr:nucleotidyltransferase family protein [Clostridia bacterium]